MPWDDDELIDEGEEDYDDGPCEVCGLWFCDCAGFDFEDDEPLD